MSSILAIETGILLKQGDQRRENIPAVGANGRQPDIVTLRRPCSFFIPSSTSDAAPHVYWEHRSSFWEQLFNMSARLRHYLIDAYATNRYRYTKIRKDRFIQIDDQDDDDALTQFCNIWVKVERKNLMHIELCGPLPITEEICDLAEIYFGYADKREGRIVLKLLPTQIEVLVDLAGLIRKTAFLGDTINNANWHKISARTISSLYRFVRVIKEFAATPQRPRAKK